MVPPSDVASLPPDELGAKLALLWKRGAEVESTIEGASMEPAIPRAARIRITARHGVPAVGAVVAIVTPAGLVAHRVVDRGRLPWSRRYVLTQGDGVRLVDPPVPVNLCLGPVTGWCTDGAWRLVPSRARSARAAGGSARLWCLAVRAVFQLHPQLATALVRLSLRGKVPPVQWRT